MTKAEWIEKQVKAKGRSMKLDAQNKATLRSMLSKEYDELEREAVREDSHNSPVGSGRNGLKDESEKKRKAARINGA